MRNESIDLESHLRAIADYPNVKARLYGSREIVQAEEESARRAREAKLTGGLSELGRELKAQADAREEKRARHRRRMEAYRLRKREMVIAKRNHQETPAWLQENNELKIRSETKSPEVSEADHEALKIIKREVCDEFCLPFTMIYGRGRSGGAASARHRLWSRCWRELGWSFAKIGREFGRDHTTIMYGCGELRVGRPRRFAK